MKLPNRERAVVPEAKTAGYLLSETHPHGRHKASFFRRFGFVPSNLETLASVLLLHVTLHDVIKVEDTPFGKRYTIEGELTVPDGRTPLVRSVWFVENGEDFPRFVTAYPLGRREE